MAFLGALSGAWLQRTRKERGGPCGTQEERPFSGCERARIGTERGQRADVGERKSRGRTINGSSTLAMICSSSFGSPPPAPPVWAAAFLSNLDQPSQAALSDLRVHNTKVRSPRRVRMPARVGNGETVCLVFSGRATFFSGSMPSWGRRTVRLPVTQAELLARSLSFSRSTYLSL